MGGYLTFEFHLTETITIIYRLLMDLRMFHETTIKKLIHILLTIIFFRKRKNDTHKTFHILKMKAHFEKESYFENEVQYKTHFENDNMFLRVKSY